MSLFSETKTVEPRCFAPGLNWLISRKTVTALGVFSCKRILKLICIPRKRKTFFIALAALDATLGNNAMKRGLIEQIAF